MRSVVTTVDFSKISKSKVTMPTPKGEYTKEEKISSKVAEEQKRLAEKYGIKTFDRSGNVTFDGTKPEPITKKTQVQIAPRTTTSVPIGPTQPIEIVPDTSFVQKIPQVITEKISPLITSFREKQLSYAEPIIKQDFREQPRTLYEFGRQYQPEQTKPRIDDMVKRLKNRVLSIEEEMFNEANRIRTLTGNANVNVENEQELLQLSNRYKALYNDRDLATIELREAEAERERRKNPFSKIYDFFSGVEKKQDDQQFRIGIPTVEALPPTIGEISEIDSSLQRMELDSQGLTDAPIQLDSIEAGLQGLKKSASTLEQFLKPKSLVEYDENGDAIIRSADGKIIAKQSGPFDDADKAALEEIAKRKQQEQQYNPMGEKLIQGEDGEIYLQEDVGPSIMDMPREVQPSPLDQFMAYGDQGSYSDAGQSLIDKWSTFETVPGSLPSTDSLKPKKYTDADFDGQDQVLITTNPNTGKEKEYIFTNKEEANAFVEKFNKQRVIERPDKTPEFDSKGNPITKYIVFNDEETANKFLQRIGGNENLSQQAFGDISNQDIFGITLDSSYTPTILTGTYGTPETVTEIVTPTPWKPSKDTSIEEQITRGLQAPIKNPLVMVQGGIEGSISGEGFLEGAGKKQIDDTFLDRTLGVIGAGLTTGFNAPGLDTGKDAKNQTGMGSDFGYAVRGIVPLLSGVKEQLFGRVDKDDKGILPAGTLRLTGPLALALPKSVVKDIEYDTKFSKAATPLAKEFAQDLVKSPVYYGATVATDAATLVLPFMWGPKAAELSGRYAVQGGIKLAIASKAAAGATLALGGGPDVSFLKLVKGQSPIVLGKSYIKGGNKAIQELQRLQLDVDIDTGDISPLLKSYAKTSDIGATPKQLASKVQVRVAELLGSEPATQFKDLPDVRSVRPVDIQPRPVEPIFTDVSPELSNISSVRESAILSNIETLRSTTVQKIKDIALKSESVTPIEVSEKLKEIEKDVISKAISRQRSRSDFERVGVQSNDEYWDTTYDTLSRLYKQNKSSWSGINSITSRSDVLADNKKLFANVDITPTRTGDILELLKSVKTEVDERMIGFYDSKIVNKLTDMEKIKKDKILGKLTKLKTAYGTLSGFDAGDVFYSRDPLKSIWLPPGKVPSAEKISQLRYALSEIETGALPQPTRKSEDMIRREILEELEKNKTPSFGILMFDRSGSEMPESKVISYLSEKLGISENAIERQLDTLKALNYIKGGDLQYGTGRYVITKRGEKFLGEVKPTSQSPIFAVDQLFELPKTPDILPKGATSIITKDINLLGTPQRGQTYTFTTEILGKETLGDESFTLPINGGFVGGSLYKDMLNMNLSDIVGTSVKSTMYKTLPKGTFDTLPSLTGKLDGLIMYMRKKKNSYDIIDIGKKLKKKTNYDVITDTKQVKITKSTIVDAITSAKIKIERLPSIQNNAERLKQIQNTRDLLMNIQDKISTKDVFLRSELNLLVETLDNTLVPETRFSVKPDQFGELDIPKWVDDSYIKEQTMVNPKFEIMENEGFIVQKPQIWYDNLGQKVQQIEFVTNKPTTGIQESGEVVSKGIATPDISLIQVLKQANYIPAQGVTNTVTITTKKGGIKQLVRKIKLKRGETLKDAVDKIDARTTYDIMTIHSPNARIGENSINWIDVTNMPTNTLHKLKSTIGISEPFEDIRFPGRKFVSLSTSAENEFDQSVAAKVYTIKNEDGTQMYTSELEKEYNELLLVRKAINDTDLTMKWNSVWGKKGTKYDGYKLTDGLSRKLKRKYIKNKNFIRYKHINKKDGDQIIEPIDNRIKQLESIKDKAREKAVNEIIDTNMTLIKKYTDVTDSDVFQNSPFKSLDDLDNYISDTQNIGATSVLLNIAKSGDNGVTTREVNNEYLKIGQILGPNVLVGETSKVTKNTLRNLASKGYVTHLTFDKTQNKWIDAKKLLKKDEVKSGEIPESWLSLESNRNEKWILSDDGKKVLNRNLKKYTETSVNADDISNIKNIDIEKNVAITQSEQILNTKYADHLAVMEDYSTSMNITDSTDFMKNFKNTVSDFISGTDVQISKQAVIDLLKTTLQKSRMYGLSTKEINTLEKFKTYQYVLDTTKKQLKDIEEGKQVFRTPGQYGVGKYEQYGTTPWTKESLLRREKLFETKLIDLAKGFTKIRQRENVKKIMYSPAEVEINMRRRDATLSQITDISELENSKKKLHEKVMEQVGKLRIASKLHSIPKGVTVQEYAVGGKRPVSFIKHDIKTLVNEAKSKGITLTPRIVEGEVFGFGGYKSGFRKIWTAVQSKDKLPSVDTNSLTNTEIEKVIKSKNRTQTELDTINIKIDNIKNKHTTEMEQELKKIEAVREDFLRKDKARLDPMYREIDRLKRLQQDGMTENSSGNITAQINVMYDDIERTKELYAPQYKNLDLAVEHVKTKYAKPVGDSTKVAQYKRDAIQLKKLESQKKKLETNIAKKNIKLQQVNYVVPEAEDYAKTITKLQDELTGLHPNVQALYKDEQKLQAYGDAKELLIERKNTIKGFVNTLLKSGFDPSTDNPFRVSKRSKIQEKMLGKDVKKSNVFQPNIQVHAKTTYGSKRDPSLTIYDESKSDKISYEDMIKYGKNPDIIISDSSLAPELDLLEGIALDDVRVAKHMVLDEDGDYTNDRLAEYMRSRGLSTVDDLNDDFDELSLARQMPVKGSETWDEAKAKAYEKYTNSLGSVDNTNTVLGKDLKYIVTKKSDTAWAYVQFKRMEKAIDDQLQEMDKAEKNIGHRVNQKVREISTVEKIFDEAQSNIATKAPLKPQVLKVFDADPDLKRATEYREKIQYEVDNKDRNELNIVNLWQESEKDYANIESNLPKLLSSVLYVSKKPEFIEANANNMIKKLASKDSKYSSVDPDHVVRLSMGRMPVNEEQIADLEFQQKVNMAMDVARELEGSWKIHQSKIIQDDLKPLKDVKSIAKFWYISKDGVMHKLKHNTSETWSKFKVSDKQDDNLAVALTELLNKYEKDVIKAKDAGLIVTEGKYKNYMSDFDNLYQTTSNLRKRAPFIAKARENIQESSNSIQKIKTEIGNDSSLTTDLRLFALNESEDNNIKKIILNTIDDKEEILKEIDNELVAMKGQKSRLSMELNKVNKELSYADNSKKQIIHIATALKYRDNGDKYLSNPIWKKYLRDLETGAIEPSKELTDLRKGVAHINIFEIKGDALKIVSESEKLDVPDYYKTTRFGKAREQFEGFKRLQASKFNLPVTKLYGKKSEGGIEFGSKREKFKTLFFPGGKIPLESLTEAEKITGQTEKIITLSPTTKIINLLGGFDKVPGTTIDKMTTTVSKLVKRQPELLGASGSSSDMFAKEPWFVKRTEVIEGSEPLPKELQKIASNIGDKDVFETFLSKLSGIGKEKTKPVVIEEITRNSKFEETVRSLGITVKDVKTLTPEIFTEVERSGKFTGVDKKFLTDIVNQNRIVSDFEARMRAYGFGDLVTGTVKPKDAKAKINEWLSTNIDIASINPKNSMSVKDIDKRLVEIAEYKNNKKLNIMNIPKVSLKAKRALIDKIDVITPEEKQLIAEKNRIKSILNNKSNVIEVKEAESLATKATNEIDAFIGEKRKLDGLKYSYKSYKEFEYTRKSPDFKPQTRVLKQGDTETVTTDDAIFSQLFEDFSEKSVVTTVKKDFIESLGQQSAKRLSTTKKFASEYFNIKDTKIPELNKKRSMVEKEINEILAKTSQTTGTKMAKQSIATKIVSEETSTRTNLQSLIDSATNSDNKLLSSIESKLKNDYNYNISGLNNISDVSKNDRDVVMELVRLHSNIKKNKNLILNNDLTKLPKNEQDKLFKKYSELKNIITKEIPSAEFESEKIKGAAYAELIDFLDLYKQKLDPVDLETKKIAENIKKAQTGENNNIVSLSNKEVVLKITDPTFKSSTDYSTGIPWIKRQTKKVVKFTEPDTTSPTIVDPSGQQLLDPDLVKFGKIDLDAVSTQTKKYVLNLEKSKIAKAKQTKKDEVSEMARIGSALYGLGATGLPGVGQAYGQYGGSGGDVYGEPTIGQAYLKSPIKIPSGPTIKPQPKSLQDFGLKQFELSKIKPQSFDKFGISPIIQTKPDIVTATGLRTNIGLKQTPIVKQSVIQTPKLVTKQIPIVDTRIIQENKLRLDTKLRQEQLPKLRTLQRQVFVRPIAREQVIPKRLFTAPIVPLFWLQAGREKRKEQKPKKQKKAKIAWAVPDVWFGHYDPEEYRVIKGGKTPKKFLTGNWGFDTE